MTSLYDSPIVTAMRGRSDDWNPVLLRKVAKLSSKYTLEYCGRVLESNPVKVTCLLAYILEGSNLSDPDQMALKLGVGHPYIKENRMKITDLTPDVPVTLTHRPEVPMANPGPVVVDKGEHSQPAPALDIMTKPVTKMSRADRNNNPACITVNVAQQARLILGVDYIPGDPFPAPSKEVTAKLLGDCVATTIEVINRLGYYTHVGAYRWSYMAIPAPLWFTFTDAQKRVAVACHYRVEGGTVLNTVLTPCDLGL